MEANEFLNYKNWIVAGSVLNETKYAYKILNALKAKGYNVIGVKPKSKDQKVYNSIKDVPHKIDVLDLCINPVLGIDVVKEAVDLGIDKILIQPGAESDEIIKYCKEKNISAIKGCALVELSK